MKTNLGGDRLGSGNKIDVAMRNYERSTHDLSYIWRSTMSSGTLVPCFSELALPADTFDIDIDCEVMTHPTIGPLFGSFKVQIDMFEVPIRLYQAQLSMNLNNIGMSMENVLLPQIGIEGSQLEQYEFNLQVNPSCVLAYFGIMGAGRPSAEGTIYRQFNAVPYLGYVDIYKNYYANKQEGTNLWGSSGVVIHNPLLVNDYSDVSLLQLFNPSNTTTPTNIEFDPNPQLDEVEVGLYPSATLKILLGDLIRFNIESVLFAYNGEFVKAVDVFEFNEVILGTNGQVRFWGVKQEYQYAGTPQKVGVVWFDESVGDLIYTAPKLRRFNLDNIDLMRKQLLKWDEDNGAFILNGQMQDIEPYSLLFHNVANEGKNYYSIQSNQEGLLIKTYQSDIYNNWVNTEWLEGDNGVNAITAVQVIDGEFSIDQLNLKKKIYEVLMRVATSDGTYNSWVKATWGHEEFKGYNSPMYLGGYSTELVFQEIVSNAATSDQPLGTLAGRGKVTQQSKGGKVTVRTNEPSYIMGIVSITPRIDYSQGNKWDMLLKNMDEFHKPALDGIGFQDLVTDGMAWFETAVQPTAGDVDYFSAGKIPAWTNYQTSVNRVYGNFAIETQQMWMTLNRKYEVAYDEQGYYAGIKDLTTYIDPVKFNHIFADTRLDAQNFWVQIKFKNTVRRKMSARQIPNF